MKNTTRRNLFKKLGVGAAAIAALSVAGTSQTAKAGPAPVDPKRTVSVEGKDGNYQVVVALGGTGQSVGVFLDMFESNSPKLGLYDAQHLGLGVKVSDGKVSIRGLDALVNRSYALQAGRCYAEDVSVKVGLTKM